MVADLGEGGEGGGGAVDPGQNPGYSLYPAPGMGSPSGQTDDGCKNTAARTDF